MKTAEHHNNDMNLQATHSWNFLPAALEGAKMSTKGHQTTCEAPLFPTMLIKLAQQVHTRNKLSNLKGEAQLPTCK